MSYTRLRYHLIIATQDRQNVLTPEVKTILYPALQNKALDHCGQLLKVGGDQNHVHMVARIPRTVAVMSFMRDLKTGSSRAINKSCLFKKEFHWQENYGAITLHPFELGPVLRYVANQESHHKNGTLWPDYERVRRKLAESDIDRQKWISYTCLRYHLITTTKYREMLLTQAVEDVFYPAMYKKADEIGCRLLEANGVEDHTHLVAAIHPTVTVADFMRIVKTAGSRAINKSRLSRGQFNWQDGYGAFTLEPFNLSPVRQSVINQKIHHKTKNLWPAYEKVSGDSR